MKKGWKFREDILPTALKALGTDKFAVTGLGSVHWELGFSCVAPIGSTAWSSLDYRGHAPMTLTMRVRCRKCLPCRRSKAAHWAARAVDEIGKANRTWFATLTLRPSEHWRLMCRAARRLSDCGVDYDALNSDQQFAETSREAFAEAVKMWKRLRHASAFTYLMVTEAHKSGVPHLHCLVHEKDAERPLRHAQLRKEWPLGFSTFKLVDGPSGAAAYVTKYLFKNPSELRVRSSRGYGKIEATQLDCIQATNGLPHGIGDGRSPVPVIQIGPSSKPGGSQISPVVCDDKLYDLEDTF